MGGYFILGHRVLKVKIQWRVSDIIFPKENINQIDLKSLILIDLDTLNSKICPLFHILDTETGWCEKKWEGVGTAGIHFYRIR